MKSLIPFSVFAGIALAVLLLIATAGIVLKVVIDEDVRQGNRDQAVQSARIIENQEKIIKRLDSLESVQKTHAKAIEKNSEVIKELNPEAP